MGAAVVGAAVVGAMVGTRVVGVAVGVLPCTSGPPVVGALVVGTDVGASVVGAGVPCVGGGVGAASRPPVTLSTQRAEVQLPAKHVEGLQA